MTDENEDLVKKMNDTYENHKKYFIEAYKNYSLDELKEAQEIARGAYRRTSAGKEAAQCEVLFELIEAKI